MVDLQAIRDRLEAATEGPWSHVTDDDGRGRVEHAVWSGRAGKYAAEDIAAENADFIPKAPTDIAALLAEVERLQFDLETKTVVHRCCEEVQTLRAERDRARQNTYEIEQQIRDGEASDGYHTHNELYDYRMLYNAHAANGWHAASIPAVKSWRHSDGELCFGGGWFIVTAALPTGQVSNHYPAIYWGLFCIPEVEIAPEYDGHTSDEAAERLHAALTENKGGQ